MASDAPPILLLGGQGQVGWHLRRALAPLGPVVAPSRAEVDLTDEAALRALVARLRPGCVVNAAAYTAVDRAEQEPDRAHAVNARAPAVLAEAARDAGALLVHYSTDYVFDGTADRPYTEADPTAPLNVYGRTKRAGEEAVVAAGGAYLVLRTSWVYGLRRHNFFLTMLRLARQGGPLRVVSTQVGAPTPAWLIAEVTAQVLARRQTLPEDRRPVGLFHLTAGGQTSWHGFAEALLQRTLGPEAPPVLPITPDAYPTPAARPAYSVLDTTRIRQTFGVHLPSWEDALLPVCEAAREWRSLPPFLLGA